MPVIRPIDAVCYAPRAGGDVSALIAPPYDVLNEADKARLLAGNPHNIVAIDLPHLPAKTVGPDQVYEQAGRTYRQWLAEGVLARRPKPGLFVYQQTYTAVKPGDRSSGKGQATLFRRRGLVANVRIQPFGKASDGRGGVFPHEQTFSGPKEDRMKLMCATKAQLSPIFGLYSDPRAGVGPLLEEVVAGGPAGFHGVTGNDNVRHEVWPVDQPGQVERFVKAMEGLDVFIADGHHRYTTALNYRQRLIDAGTIGAATTDHRACNCLFVLVAMQDPGMIVLPTHRVLGGMKGFSFEAFVEAGKGRLAIQRFEGGGLEALEAALPDAGPHAMGLYVPSNPKQPFWIATTASGDPLAQTHSNRDRSWRELDVAILQHLVVEQVCQPGFCGSGEPVAWKFPHTLSELQAETQKEGFQLGVVMQPTPLESVRKVSEAGELMPQKSTFFYPKLATGLMMNPLE